MSKTNTSKKISKIYHSVAHKKPTSKTKIENTTGGNTWAKDNTHLIYGKKNFNI